MPPTTLQEICAASELCDLIADARRSRFLARWRKAARVYLLTVTIQRTPGRRLRAHAIALRTAALFCLPRPLVRRISRYLPTFTWP